MLNKSKPSRNVGGGGGYLSNTLNTRLFKRLRLVLIPLIFTFILTVSSVYADNNNTYNSNQTYNIKSVVNYNRGTIDNSEQYKLTINKDSNITNTHVELLPDDNGNYWIPKGYKIKVTSDCKDGYIQLNNSDAITMSETKTINLNSSTAPPSRLDELESKINVLEEKINNSEQSDSQWELLAYASGASDQTIPLDLNIDDFECIYLAGMQAWEENGKIYYNHTCASDYFYSDTINNNVIIDSVACHIIQHLNNKSNYISAIVQLNHNTKKFTNLVYINRWDAPGRFHGCVLFGKRKRTT